MNQIQQLHHLHGLEPAKWVSFYRFWPKIHIQGGSIPLKSLKRIVYVLLSYISFILEVLTTAWARMSEFEPKVPLEGHESRSLALNGRSFKNDLF